MNSYGQGVLQFRNDGQNSTTALFGRVALLGNQLFLSSCERGGGGGTGGLQLHFVFVYTTDYVYSLF